MSRSLWLRRLAIVMALVVLLAWVLWPAARPVDSASVDRGPVLESFEAEGRTRVRDRYLIASPVNATARRLQLQPGDAVEAGQVLALLDPLHSAPLDARSRGEAQARLAAAEARLQAAREAERAAAAAAQQLQADAERAGSLRAQGLIAASAAQQAQTAAQRAARELGSARFQAAASAHEAELAAVALDSTGQAMPAIQLRAPVAGVLLRRHFESARPVALGEPLLEIGDLASLEVEVDVLSSDAVRLSPGMPVDLLRWGEAEALSGHVLRIEPGGFTKLSALGVEEQRVWVIVALDSPREHWLRLGDAYRVSAGFRLQSVDDA
ncbi:MAG TPA: HlyD family efflux transporter periplasmic adaptor subunit, partial [Arenimonas sp.]|nr:HlyD family efflux transporter periplasmic adaptor subunit [Arenimonas sp.]